MVAVHRDNSETALIQKVTVYQYLHNERKKVFFSKAKGKKKFNREDKVL